MGDEFQDIQDEIDKGVNAILRESNEDEVTALGDRLCAVIGTTSNASSMVGFAAAVAHVFSDAPPESRDKLLVVFMRLVQQMLDIAEDCGDRH